MSSLSAATLTAHGGDTAVDGRLHDALESRDMVQRVDQPSHQDVNILDLLMDVDGSGITSNIRLVDAGLSDHYQVMTDINVAASKARCAAVLFQELPLCGPKVLRCESDDDRRLYINPSDHVDIFCTQVQSTVTAVLDALAPLKTRTKRCDKRLQQSFVFRCGCYCQADTTTDRASLEAVRNRERSFGLRLRQDYNKKLTC